LSAAYALSDVKSCPRGLSALLVGHERSALPDAWDAPLHADKSTRSSGETTRYPSVDELDLVETAKYPDVRRFLAPGQKPVPMALCARTFSDLYLALPAIALPAPCLGLNTACDFGDGTPHLWPEVADMLGTRHSCPTLHAGSSAETVSDTVLGGAVAKGDAAAAWGSEHETAPPEKRRRVTHEPNVPDAHLEDIRALHERWRREDFTDGLPPPALELQHGQPQTPGSVQLAVAAEGADADLERAFETCRDVIAAGKELDLDRRPWKGVAFHRRTLLFEGHLWHNGKQLYLGSYPSLGMALRAHDLMCLNCKDDPSSFLQLPRCDYSSIEHVARSVSQQDFMHLLRRAGRELKTTVS